MKYTRKSVLDYTHKQGYKDVLSSSAPIATVCVKENCKDKEVRNAYDILDNMKIKYIREYYLCVFLLETGCRVSEALRVTHKDIDALGRVRVSGMKNSSSRIVYSPSAIEFLLEQRKIRGDIWERFNRFYIYRILKLHGFGMVYGKNEKMSITHYFRHVNAIIAEEISVNILEIAQILGHKKVKNTAIYLNVPRETSKNKKI